MPNNLFLNVHNTLLATKCFDNTFLPTVSCHAFGEVAKPWRRYTNTAVDVYKIISGASLCSITNCNAVLYLCRYRDAGN